MRWMMNARLHISSYSTREWHLFQFRSLRTPLIQTTIDYFLLLISTIIFAHVRGRARLDRTIKQIIKTSSAVASTYESTYILYENSRQFRWWLVFILSTIPRTIVVVLRQIKIVILCLHFARVFLLRSFATFGRSLVRSNFGCSLFIHNTLCCRPVLIIYWRAIYSNRFVVEYKNENIYENLPNEKSVVGCNGCR